MMPDRCDYKDVHVSKTDKTVTVDIIVYKGKVATIVELNEDFEEVPLTLYRRSEEVLRDRIVFDRPINDNAIKGNLKNRLKDLPGLTPIDEQS